MTCADALPQISALYDGQVVPTGVAEHVQTCTDCRVLLRSYIELGVEIKLAARQNVRPSDLPAGLRAKLRGRGENRFFARRILVPRFAVGVLALALLVSISAGWTILRAQSSAPLWFEYQTGINEVGTGSAYTAKGGSDEKSGWIIRPGASNFPGLPRVAYRIRVVSVEPNEVRLEVGARGFGLGNSLPEGFEEKLKQVPTKPFVYKPGKDLSVGIGQGVNFVIRGEIFDHQPKLAWGMPVEPGPDELVMTHPMLIENDRVVMDARYSGAAPDFWAQFLGVPGHGRLVLALRHFPDAVEAQTDWGQLSFEWGGSKYVLATASPMTGGEQPRTVWVRFDSKETAGWGIERLPVD